MTTGGRGQIGNVDLVKQINGAAVYRLIDQQGPISRIQIAELSHLAPASVTKITRQLIERGLIREVSQQASTGGRRAISIVTETRQFQAIGVRLGRYDATITLFDLSAKALSEDHYPLPQRDQQTLEVALLDALADFITAHQRKIRELISIAVVVPGLVDSDAGVVNYMPHMPVDSWKLVAALEQRFALTCFVGHDIRSLTLAEHYFGALRGCADAMLVRVHRGTGAGIISNGRLFTGRSGNVAEIGHIQVDPLGERCHCGNFGCLETIAANAAIEQKVRGLLAQGHESRLTLNDCAIEAICRAALEGDALAEGVLSNVARQLGKAISVAINLFNPQKVVIAGELMAAETLLLPIIDRCIDTQVLNAFRHNLPIVRSALDDRSAIGAFALVKRAMLNGTLLQRLLDSHTAAGHSGRLCGNRQDN